VQTLSLSLLLYCTKLHERDDRESEQFVRFKLLRTAPRQ
jgi:hypothetical protein